MKHAECQHSIQEGWRYDYFFLLIRDKSSSSEIILETL